MFQMPGSKSKAPPRAIGSKLVTFTRDVSLAAGAQSITGVGFKPSSIEFLANINGSSAFSIGFYDGVNSYVVFDDNVDAAGTYGSSATRAAYLTTGGGISGQMVGTSLDVDGFTVTWSKSGAPTGTVTIFARCNR